MKLETLDGSRISEKSLLLEYRNTPMLLLLIDGDDDDDDDDEVMNMIFKWHIKIPVVIH